MLVESTEHKDGQGIRSWAVMLNLNDYVSFGGNA
jgi:hypothetical protein